MPRPPSPVDLFALALLSAATLTFEVVLTRFFAIQQFHHFAFVVISLGVMGSAASGLLLALRPRHPPLGLLSLAFALSVALADLTINFLPFDSYAIAWDPKQLFILINYFLAAGAPFLFSGWTVGAFLVNAGPTAHRPYAVNLVGSALGLPLALASMEMLNGAGAIWLAAALGLLSAVLFSQRRLARFSLALLAAFALLLTFRTPSALTLRLSPYKSLSAALLAPGARLGLSRWGATARVDVVESSSTHVFPGLSLNADVELPRQVALFVDGDGPLPITALSPDSPAAAELAYSMPTALAYQLRPTARALILDAGAGLEAVLALAAGADHIDLSNEEPLVRETLVGSYAGPSQWLFRDPRLTLLAQAARGAMRSDGESYDIIQFALRDAFRPVTSGAFSLNENFLLTVESMADAYRRLRPDGLLVITRWLGNPPSESAKAWATLLAALDAEGVAEPAARLIAFRSMRTATLIAARRPLSAGELAAARAFLHANGFDPIFLPDLTADELNRSNVLPRDIYHELFAAVMRDPRTAIAENGFNLQPSTDNRPFFFHFFRWRQTSEVLATLGLTWQPFGGSGYLTLLLLLGVMLLFAVPLAVAPALVFRRRRGIKPVSARFALFFLCLGAGYLFVEIPLIQRFTLLLERPSLSFSLVLFCLLLGSGFGSLLSPRLELRRSLASLVGVLCLSAALLPALIRWALPWAWPGRFALAALLLLPAGFLMGVPFASGLRQLVSRSPGSVPWAWAINGAVSGVSGVAAAMVSLDLGFAATLVFGALAYAGAWIAARNWGR